MVKAEQLQLPDLHVHYRGPVAIVMSFKDTHTANPRVLLAERPNRKKTFPGGKLRRHELPIKGAIREYFEETGLRLWSSEMLIESHMSPLRIATEGVERDMYIYYCFAEEAGPSMRPMHREPLKNSAWRYISIRTLPKLISLGRLHPMVSRTNMNQVILEAQELVGETRDVMEWLRRHRAIIREIRRSEYGFLSYIHDRDDQHFTDIKYMTDHGIPPRKVARAPVYA